MIGEEHLENVVRSRKWCLVDLEHLGGVALMLELVFQAILLMHLMQALLNLMLCLHKVLSVGLSVVLPWTLHRG